MTALGAAMSLVALGVSVSLAAYVLGKRPGGAANRAFAVLMFAFALWDGSEVVVRSAPAGTPDATLYPWIQAAWLGIALVPAGLMHVALAYPEPSPVLRKRWTLTAIYAPWLAWAFLILGTDLVIEGVTSNFFGPSALVSTLTLGPVVSYDVFAVVFGAWLYGAVALFVRAWWRERKGRAGPTQRIVVVGLLLGSLPAGITEVFWPVWTAADTPLGLGSMYTLAWSVFIAYAVARYRYLVIPPVTESRLAVAARHSLEPGLNHLVVESGRSTAMGAFREIVSKTPGLCVTALAPERIVRRFGLERTPILWVTTASTGERTVRPTGLDFELLHTVTKFLRANPGTAVLLDDVDYLSEILGSDAVARFVRRVTNQASACRGTVILGVGSRTLRSEHLAVLRGSVDDVLEVPGVPDPPGPEGGHVLVVVPSEDAPTALTAAGAHGGLLMTTEHPAKAKRRFGPNYDCLWLSEAGEPGEPRVPPSSLDAEGKRALAQFIASHRGSDIVIAGLEQLALYNDFRSILGFVKDGLDLATVGGCRVFVTVAQDAFSPREVALLARRFDIATLPGVVRKAPPSGLTTGAPESRTPFRGPVS